MNFRQACATVLASALVGCGGDDPEPAPTENRYVAMGDSYSSGHGTEPHPDMGRCSRTRHAYARLWAQRHGMDGFTFVACQGATTDNVLHAAQTAQGETAPQIAALSEQTRMVTITIGGNDTGFADIARSCAQSEIFDKDKASCLRQVQQVRDIVDGRALLPDNTTFYQHLLRTYQAIRARVNADARIYVLGYPQFYWLPPGLEAIGPETRQRADELMQAMNRVIARAALDAGVSFVDADRYFSGHGAGSDNPNAQWINDISLGDIHVSLHPNIDGHAQGYLAALEDATGR